MSFENPEHLYKSYLELYDISRPTTVREEYNRRIVFEWKNESDAFYITFFINGRVVGTHFPKRRGIITSWCANLETLDNKIVDVPEFIRNQRG